MRVLRFPESGPSVKMGFGFRAYFGLKWAKKAQVSRRIKRKGENGNWVLQDDNLQILIEPADDRKSTPISGTFSRRTCERRQNMFSIL